MNKANECTCPSGDGSLVHPCPAHPAVEQAVGDERAAFEAAFAAMGRPVCRADYDQDAYGTPFDDGGWTGWQARAALAHRAPEVCSECSDTGKVYDESGDGPWSCYACTGNPEVIGYANGDELDNMLDDRTAVLSPGKTSFHTVPVYRLIRAALAQPSPASVCATPAGENCPGDGVKSCKKCPEQPEAERPELWAVHAQGPDELYAAFTREDAEKHAAELNALPMPEGIAVGAVVVPSPWPEAEHWKYLAGQERDHKNEIAGRLRQFERICEGLPQGAIDGGWTVHGIRGYAKRLEDQLKAALARVAELESKLAELEKQEPVALANRGNQGFWVEWTEAAAGLYGSGIKLYAATVAQSQHSVPIAPELKRALGLVVAALEADGDRPTSKYALSELKKVLAAAPGNSAQHSVPGDIMRDAQRYRWLRDQQFYFSFSTENSDAGISSCTAGMSSRFKNLSWVDAAIDSAIAAAPGKEVGHE